jgi:uncharacterized protein YkwD
MSDLGASYIKTRPSKAQDVCSKVRMKGLLYFGFFGLALCHPGLEAHNEVRGEYGVGPLKWSDDLENSASKHAKRLARRQCALENSGERGVGENLYMSSPSGSVDKAVDSWTKKKEGTWSQVVWKNSKNVGCAVAKGVGKGGSSCTVVVCKYQPP